MAVNIVVNFCCKQKMLKETETKQTVRFLVTFLSLVTFQLGGRAGSLVPWTSLSTPMTKVMLRTYFLITSNLN